MDLLFAMIKICFACISAVFALPYYSGFIQVEALFGISVCLRTVFVCWAVYDFQLCRNKSDKWHSVIKKQANGH